MLFNDMSTLVDEVRQIEGRVVEISRLQEVFAEKVLEQVSLLHGGKSVVHCCIAYNVLATVNQSVSLSVRSAGQHTGFDSGQ